MRSPYLTGSYEPVQTEITADLDVVAGALPDDLAGCFVRNSSNPRFEPKGRYHWFDGDGMVHGVHLGQRHAPPTATPTCAPRAWPTTRPRASRLVTGILEQPDLTRPGGPWKDTANTDLVFHAGQLLAVWWLGGDPHVIRLPDLETLGIQTYGGKRHVRPVGPPQGRPGHRRDDLVRLLAAAAVPDLRRDLGRRRAGPPDRDHPRRAPPAARHRHHRAVHGPHGHVA